MLQQTVVATVIPYYAKFLSSYPSIERLGAAPLDEVLGMWAGLGYYARARNLHACAQAVTALGGFPRTIEGLRALPGIGPYTANAIGAIAFQVPALPVDGNIERVASRIFAIEAELPAGKPAIATAAGRLMEDDAARAAPGDFAQALFDLGATICTPRSPACGICPWMGHCAAQARGIEAELPRRAKKPAKPRRTGIAYVLLDESDEVFLIRRPPRGLLGGMLALPEAPPIATQWRDAGAIEHVFTHFALTLSVRVAREKLPDSALRAPAATASLPSVMRKALDAGRRALDDAA
ncbi:MAG TPA: A/G-specific adenine glycosylase [Acidocella sp.]|jgi:A/G-specific adenine glycosylase|uniref:A/G-specific adenine glycosylase n=1 Tax=Acidocella sp. TaxID=50710 RepID=UPI002B7D1863|nr:A/G-specific adenine glycosylase [Acidocella sp.]HVE22674.1 A/G-specific adenine glycosylase [Acidocella sp.]